MPRGIARGTLEGREACTEHRGEDGEHGEDDEEISGVPAGDGEVADVDGVSTLGHVEASGTAGTWAGGTGVPGGRA